MLRPNNTLGINAVIIMVLVSLKQKEMITMRLGWTHAENTPQI